MVSIFFEGRSITGEVGGKSGDSLKEREFKGKKKGHQDEELMVSLSVY